LIAEFFDPLMKKLFVLTALFFSMVHAYGQEIRIERTEITDGKVIIHYALVDTVADRFYTVRLYSSQDNFMHPLKQVTGDMGVEIRPGQRQLTWDPLELGQAFNGKVALELKARVYVPFIRFEGFREYYKVRRLTPYTITWSGGSAREVLNFDLVKGDKKVMTFPNIANVGHHTFEFPANIRPGVYRLRASDSKNEDDVVISEEFRIIRKTPLVLKAVSVVATGIGITFLSQDGPAGFQIPDPITP